MNTNQTGKLINVLLSISALLVIIGGIFKLQHYPYGNLILSIGIAGWFLLLGIKTFFQRKKKHVIKVD
jgi:hypothetical protein